MSVAFSGRVRRLRGERLERKLLLTEVPFSQQIVIDEVAGDLSAADIDGDADLDVLSLSDGGQVAWYENTDGAGTFGPQRVITASADTREIYAADLDGDGDQDVLASSSWYENLDGQGTFGPERVISTGHTSWSDTSFAADLDGDDDLDVLTTFSFFGHPRDYIGIFWYENTDGAGNFGPRREILTFEGEFSIGTLGAADLDGDGDQDVLWSSFGGWFSRTWWLANVDGEGTFGPVQLIAIKGEEGECNYADRVAVADLDSDGDLDVLTIGEAIYGRKSLIWYGNTDGQGTFGPSRSIDTDEVGAAVAADLDGDGDLDLLSTEIAWYENTDGRGNYGPRVGITAEGDAIAADLDGDGDLDVLAAGEPGVLFWLRNESPPRLVADFNSDGEVDGDDFLIWQQGFAQYSGSALPEHGDADGNGYVNGDDFLLWQQEFGAAGGAAGSGAVATDASGQDDRAPQVKRYPRERGNMDGGPCALRSRFGDRTFAALGSLQEAGDRPVELEVAILGEELLHVLAQNHVL